MGDHHGRHPSLVPRAQGVPPHDERGLAHGQPVARPEWGHVHPRPVHERPVAAPEVTHDPPLAPASHHRMASGDLQVGVQRHTRVVEFATQHEPVGKCDLQPGRPGRGPGRLRPGGEVDRAGDRGPGRGRRQQPDRGHAVRRQRERARAGHRPDALDPVAVHEAAPVAAEVLHLEASGDIGEAHVPARDHRGLQPDVHPLAPADHQRLTRGQLQARLPDPDLPGRGPAVGHRHSFCSGTSPGRPSTRMSPRTRLERSSLRAVRWHTSSSTRASPTRPSASTAPGTCLRTRMYWRT